MSLLPTYHVLIRESHVDSLGHVNNATYLSLMEEARWDVITQNGYGFLEIQKQKKGPVILEVDLKFLREIQLRETVTITLEMLSYEGKVGRMRQQIIKSDGTPAAEALFVFGFFDMRTRRLIDPTPEWARAIGMEDRVGLK